MKPNTPPEPLAHTVNNSRRLAGGVCRQTIYDMIHAGELEAIKFGGRTLVTDRSLRARLGLNKPPSA